MVNVTDLTINAMFYVYFVVLSGGLALVTAFLIGNRLYIRQKDKLERKTTVKGVKTNKANIATGGRA